LLYKEKVGGKGRITPGGVGGGQRGDTKFHTAYTMRGLRRDPKGDTWDDQGRTAWSRRGFPKERKRVT